MAYHAILSAKRWAVRRTGARRAIRVFEIQSDAWDEARRMARAVRDKAYLHDRTGRIVARNDYETPTDLY